MGCCPAVDDAMDFLNGRTAARRRSELDLGRRCQVLIESSSSALNHIAAMSVELVTPMCATGRNDSTFRT